VQSITPSSNAGSAPAADVSVIHATQFTSKGLKILRNGNSNKRWRWPAPDIFHTSTNQSFRKQNQVSKAVCSPATAVCCSAIMKFKQGTLHFSQHHPRKQRTPHFSQHHPQSFPQKLLEHEEACLYCRVFNINNHTHTHTTALVSGKMPQE